MRDYFHIWNRFYVGPVRSLYEKTDNTICGDCKHRGTTCYVAVHNAPNQIYRYHKNKKYPLLKDWQSYFKDRLVRIGSYGDPTVVPVGIWHKILRYCKAHTGYTHLWKNRKNKYYRNFLMASVDSEEERELAHRLEWRTFRVKNKEDVRQDKEIICPASEEAGKVLTCATCLYCNGGKHTEFGRKDVVINIHGLPHKILKFKKLFDKTSIENIIRYAQPILDEFGHNIELDLHYTQAKPTADYKSIERNHVRVDIKYHGKVIDKPHKFLNEARLSAIAISIYLGMIKRHVQGLPCKILFLDDIFIGLDIGNRLPLLRILDDKFSQYQI